MRREVRQHRELGRLAAAQHGVVSHRQLSALGYSRAAIARGVKGGRLFPVFRGAYGVGHPPTSSHAVCMAAVLSCGRGALLSHSSSSWLWGLGAPAPVKPEITVPQRGHCREGIVIHHSTILEPSDRAEQELLPTTSIPRTLLDLAGSGGMRRLRGTVDRARRRGLLDIGAIDSLLVRSGGHRGRAPLSDAVRIYREEVFDRARSELLFLDLIKKAGLPPPAINYVILGIEVDAYWERERFAVEIDGWEAHGNRASFEKDPVQLEDLKLAGIDAIRITAKRIETRPREVADRLSRHLQRRRRELEPQSH